MVDLTLLQSVSYIVGAIGVCVAAFYYVFNLKETSKNRLAATSNNVQQLFHTEEWQQRFLDVMNMQWSTFDDFKEKYDSKVNPLNYVKRNTLLVQYDNIGRQYRSGLIDLDAFGSVSAYAFVLT